jgi:hypothetical protein
MMDDDAILHHVYDSLCGWCYAASPMVEAVANAGHPYGEEYGINLLGESLSRFRVVKINRKKRWHYPVSSFRHLGSHLLSTRVRSFLTSPDSVKRQAQ